MSKGSFQKFIKQEDKGAKLKEKIRQEKKKVRLETKEFFTKKKAEAKAAYGQSPRQHNTSSGPDKKRFPQSTEGHQFVKRKAASGADKRSRPEAASYKPPASGGRDRQAPVFEKPKKPSSTASKPIVVSPAKGAVQPALKKDAADKVTSTEMPLNKFVAHAGVCSRRDAAELVKSGKVSVNGQVIAEPGFKVTGKEDIRIQGKKITASKNLVYILLNKPKDHITTTEDPQGRKTVMDIVKNATSERVFPIGRLDRNTTGVLLLTNDGELAQKLSHPSYEVRKIYEVTLDKPLTKKDFDELLKGVQLEDGFIAPDSLAYADALDKSIIGIEIHSGKNRVVRRIFEKLGYDVRNLDRVMYANLTKKNVERGKFRFLQEKEIRLLKFMNASYAKKK